MKLCWKFKTRRHVTLDTCHDGAWGHTSWMSHVSMAEMLVFYVCFVIKSLCNKPGWSRYYWWCEFWYEYCSCPCMNIKIKFNVKKCHFIFVVEFKKAFKSQLRLSCQSWLLSHLQSKAAIFIRVLMLTDHWYFISDSDQDGVQDQAHWPSSVIWGELQTREEAEILPQEHQADWDQGSQGR